MESSAVNGGHKGNTTISIKSKALSSIGELYFSIEVPSIDVPIRIFGTLSEAKDLSDIVRKKGSHRLRRATLRLMNISFTHVSVYCPVEISAGSMAKTYEGAHAGALPAGKDG
jgi:hypothetical protein